MVDRLIRDALVRTDKSILLLGPRQTGKSTLLSQLGPDLTINLALERQLLAHTARASELEEQIAEHDPKSVFIDEIQRLPSLLNTVQAIIDERKRAGRPIKFLLTGSSARKLRRGKANLLPGRVHVHELGPLIAAELDHRVSTQRALSLGLLPEPYLEENREDAERLLESYAATYLKEEIQAEAATRNLEGFSRFLFVAAEHSGRFLDFSKLASQAKVSRSSTIRFFEILEDTLIAHRTLPFGAASGADQVKHPRFFFFDHGVLNGLRGDFATPPERMGNLFEHLLFNQIRVSAAARGKRCRISNFRTRGGLEVDFVVELEGKTWALEAKAGAVDVDRASAVFAQARTYFPERTEFVVVTTESENVRRRTKHARVLPWQVALREMGL